MVSLFLGFNREANLFFLTSVSLLYPHLSHFTAPLPYHEDVSQNEDFYVGFEVFTAVAMTNCTFWNIPY
jgi:hypothetical protein